MCGICGCQTINGELLNPKLVVDSMITNFRTSGRWERYLYFQPQFIGIGTHPFIDFDLSELGKQPMQYMDASP